MSGAGRVTLSPLYILSTWKSGQECKRVFDIAKVLLLNATVIIFIHITTITTTQYILLIIIIVIIKHAANLAIQFPKVVIVKRCSNRISSQFIVDYSSSTVPLSSAPLSPEL